jgi:hypothetical protein
MSLYKNVNAEVREDVNFNIGIPPVAMGQNETWASPWVSIHEMRRYVGLATIACAPDGTILTATIYEAEDSSGTGVQAISDSEVTVTASGEQSLLAIPEIRETEVSVDDGYQWVRLQMSHDNVADLIGGGLYGIVPYVRPEDSTKSTDTKECTTTSTTTAAQ